jgi:hypothetical protein
MRDLAEFFDPTLKLPIAGKVYVVQPPDAKTGIHVQRLMTTGMLAASGGEVSQSQLDELELDDADEINLYQKLLGAVYDEMLADGHPWPYVKHAGVTAFMWVAYGKDSAEQFWESAAGEAKRPEPQDRKATASNNRSRRAGSRDGSTAPRKRTTTSASPTS